MARKAAAATTKKAAETATKKITETKTAAAKKAAETKAAVKTVDVYVKPEEGVAYYVINGEGSADFKVEL